MCDTCGLEVCALAKENKMSNCTCKKAIPHDNGGCSKCGKQTGKGLLMKTPGVRPTCRHGRGMQEGCKECGTGRSVS